MKYSHWDQQDDIEEPTAAGSQEQELSGEDSPADSPAIRPSCLSEWPFQFMSPESTSVGISPTVIPAPTSGIMGYLHTLLSSTMFISLQSRPLKNLYKSHFGRPPSPKSSQRLPSYPNWIADLCKRDGSITIRTVRQNGGAYLCPRKLPDCIPQLLQCTSPEAFSWTIVKRLAGVPALLPADDLDGMLGLAQEAHCFGCIRRAKAKSLVEFLAAYCGMRDGWAYIGLSARAQAFSALLDDLKDLFYEYAFIPVNDVEDLYTRTYSEDFQTYARPTVVEGGPVTFREWAEFISNHAPFVRHEKDGDVFIGMTRSTWKKRMRARTTTAMQDPQRLLSLQFEHLLPPGASVSPETLIWLYTCVYGQRPFPDSFASPLESLKSLKCFSWRLMEDSDRVIVHFVDEPCNPVDGAGGSARDKNGPPAGSAHEARRGPIELDEIRKILSVSYAGGNEGCIFAEGAKEFDWV
ncbi:hypothetical protein HK104_003105 [Borealophlyctis nickersoniae]|nr:hypothetical protein HK104_003105 [Borealophlyctis nickersoniae]